MRQHRWKLLWPLMLGAGAGLIEAIFVLLLKNVIGMPGSKTVLINHSVNSSANNSTSNLLSNFNVTLIPSFSLSLPLLLLGLVTLRTLLQFAQIETELRLLKSFGDIFREDFFAQLKSRLAPLYRAPYAEALIKTLKENWVKVSHGLTAFFHGASAALQLLIFLPLLFFFSWKLAALVVAFVLPVFLVIRGRLHWFNTAGMAWNKAEQKLHAALNGFSDSLENILGNGEWSSQSQALEKTLAATAQQERKWGRLQAAFPPLMEWFFFALLASFALLALQGSWLGKDNANNFFPFLILLFFLHRPLREATRQFPIYWQGEKAWKEIEQLKLTLENLIEIPTPTLSKEKRFEISQLRFSYGWEMGSENKPVFARLDAQWDGAAFTAIQGPNGTGKSTLLKLIARMEMPQGGQILYPQSVMQQDQISLAYLPQRVQVPEFWPEAWKRLSYDTPMLPKALNEILNIESLIEKMQQLGAMALSGGERQRLCLARAFSSSKRYLLLDEPTVWLPGNERAEIMRALIKIWRMQNSSLGQRGLLLVSHEPELIAMADIVLDFTPSAIAV